MELHHHAQSANVKRLLLGVSLASQPVSGPFDEGGSARDLQLGLYLCRESGRRSVADIQPIRDLRKRLAVAEQFQHLTLAARQARGVPEGNGRPKAYAPLTHLIRCLKKT